MSNENNAVGMDDLLDGTLDDLADAPSFKPFAPGVHRVIIKWDAAKKINDMPTIQLDLKHVETVELKNPEDTPPVAGDETSASYMLKRVDKDTKQVVANEMAQGQFKLLIQSLAKDLNMEGASPRAVMEASQNAECLAVTGIRIDKRASKTDESQWKYYTDVTSLNTI